MWIIVFLSIFLATYMTTLIGLFDIFSWTFFFAYEVYFVACNFYNIDFRWYQSYVFLGKLIGALKVTVLCDNGQNLDN